MRGLGVQYEVCNSIGSGLAETYNQTDTHATNTGRMQVTNQWACASRGRTGWWLMAFQLIIILAGNVEERSAK